MGTNDLNVQSWVCNARAHLFARTHGQKKPKGADKRDLAAQGQSGANRHEVLFSHPHIETPARKCLGKAIGKNTPETIGYGNDDSFISLAKGQKGLTEGLTPAQHPASL
jgi:hypothetical protein